MDPIETYKLRVSAGVIQPNDHIYMLIKYIKVIEKENERLRSEIIDQQSADTTPVEDIRTPKPKRSYKKRVREGEEVRGDAGTTEDSTATQS